MTYGFTHKGEKRELTRLSEKICSGRGCIADSLDGEKFCSDCREKYLQSALMRFPPSQSGWVYFMQDTGTGHIKIGFSKNVMKRLESIQGANASEIVLLSAIPGSVKKEAALHEFFSGSRIRGEWFEESDELCELIALAVAKERARDKKRLLIAAREAGIH